MGKRHFFTDGPCPEGHFFGRATETARVLGLLRRDQNVALFGIGRIGKSSFLRHFSNLAVSEVYGLNETKYRFVSICCRDLADLGPSECRVKIIQRAQQQIPEATFAPPPDAASLTLISEWFRRFFRTVERTRLRCIIMLDHLESLVENSRLDSDFLKVLRAINSMHQVIYVVASTEPLSELEEEWSSQRHQSSPFFNIFHNLELGPFGQHESGDFLERRFESACLLVPNSVVDIIAGWAHGHPYRLQSAGAFIVRLLTGCSGEWNESLTKRLQDYLAGFPCNG